MESENLETLTSEKLDKIEELEQEIVALKQENAGLKLENIGLKQALDEKSIAQKTDSSTSSKAPSSDYGAKKVGSLKDIMNQYANKSTEEEKNPRGKQVGSKGFGRKIPANAEIQTVRHLPTNCLNCPNKEKCDAKEVCKATKNEIDFKVKIINKRHQQIARQCPMQNNQTITGHLPDRLKSSVQYGIGIIALVIYCFSLCLSYERIHSLLKCLLGDATPSTGTIHSMVEKFATSDSVKSTYAEIFLYLKRLLDVLNVDETGFRSNGKKLWMHVICNFRATYAFISESRGFKAMLEGGTAFLKGSTLVHDFWRSYFLIDGVDHAMCNAHIIRELAGIFIFYKQEWALNALLLLLKIHDAKEEALAAGIDHFSDEQIQEYKAQLLIEIKKGIEMNPAPEHKKGQKRVKNPKPLNLALRMEEYIDQILAFAINFKIPFTNNLAERAARGAKTKLKNSLYLEGTGAKDFAIIYSVLDTAKKQGMSPFEAIKTLLCGWELDISHVA